MPFTTYSYDSWNEFKSDYAKDIFGDSFLPGQYIFRGQSVSEWSLVSSFDRQYKQKTWKERTAIESDLISTFKTYCKRIDGTFDVDPIDDIGMKGIAQHYGIPTRLLDWSYSPFIAAYFAFASYRRVSDDRVAIWALKKGHEIWCSDIGVSIEENILPMNHHQKQQLGCFSLINNQENSIDGFEIACEQKGLDTEGALIKMTIPASEYKVALYELDAMNISATTIYGGIEGCAQAAKDMIRLKYLE